MKLARIAVLAIFAFAVTPLALTGCGPQQWAKFQTAYEVVTTTKVPAKAALVAIRSFDAAQVLATGYMRAPRCRDDGSNRPLCRDPGVRQQIDGFVYAGRSARNDLKAWLKSHPGEDVSPVSYEAITTAAKGIEDATAAYRAAVQ